MTTDQFRALKKRIGLSNAQLARLLGLSVSMTDKVACGQQPVGQQTALLIAAYADNRLPMDWHESHKKLQ